ncbi:DUF1345 domain-containing protein [Plantactinospora endophytica]|uniref:DUF1345 domain-containing protein n=1 Tax=Plantactinospora endophytica TaxID=673535 RepID=A0ABQ4DXY4_9ACTN|nr:DUF1345 domain-containing protein [Plantactinospora endophytica]GIG87313.1 hypothetical protein Pen02_22490 [Plantactinospora endophytica]
MLRRPWYDPPKASVQMTVITLVGLSVGVPCTFVLSPLLGPLIGWDAAAGTYLLWAWRVLWFRDSRQTAELAVQEDPSRPVRDAVLLGAGLASLLAIGILLATDQEVRGIDRELHIGLGIVSVLLSWTVVHFVFTARYARLYYTGPDGGVDFHEKEPPKYTDFAYLSFTVGMTFQVSDTDLTTKTMRVTVLGHALLSYLFGTVIIAATINLLAGLAR